jgi:hypothetical protein
MKRFKFFQWSGAAALLGACLLFSSCAERPQSEWRTIFNGENMDGWKMVGPGEFKLVNGELVTHGGMGLLWYTREKFGDCRIRVVFKPTTPQDNSGVFIRIPEAPTDPWYAVHNGYEVQIANGGSEWHRTGTIYSMSKAKSDVRARVNEWNTLVITLDGKRTRVTLNGELVTDFNEGDPVPPRTKDYEPERRERPVRGYIGLQNHDDKARVHFRSVAVAPLQPAQHTSR